MSHCPICEADEAMWKVREAELARKRKDAGEHVHLLECVACLNIFASPMMLFRARCPNCERKAMKGETE